MLVGIYGLLREATREHSFITQVTLKGFIKFQIALQIILLEACFYYFSQNSKHIASIYY